MKSPVASILLLLLATNSAPGAGEQASSSPPIPFEDAGACPFEGCVYGDWKAIEDVDVHAERRDDAPVVFKVRSGEGVKAVTGIVIITKPGRAVFDRRQRLTTSSGTIDLMPGQTLFLLTYQGEGFTKAWYGGKVYTDVDTASFMNAMCTTKPEQCTGKVVEKPQREWWIQIRNAEGQTGWTRESDKFDGKDSLG